MRRRIEVLFGVITVVVLGAGLNLVGARGAEAGVSVRERLRAARPERPGKTAVDGLETKELRKVMEERRKALPKSRVVMESEVRAMVRESLRTNRVAGDRAGAMRKAGKKDGKEEKAPREQARKMAKEGEGGVAAGRRRD